MKNKVANSIKTFAKNAKILSKTETKKVKGGITNTDLVGL